MTTNDEDHDWLPVVGKSEGVEPQTVGEQFVADLEDTYMDRNDDGLRDDLDELDHIISTDGALRYGCAAKARTLRRLIAAELQARAK